MPYPTRLDLRPCLGDGSLELPRRVLEAQVEKVWGVIRRGWLLPAVLMLASCASKTPGVARRLMETPQMSDPAHAEVSARLAAMVGAYEVERLTANVGSARPEGFGRQSALLHAATAAAAARDGRRRQPVIAAAGSYSFTRAWRTAATWIMLDAVPPHGAPVVGFPGTQAGQTVLRLRSVADVPLLVRGRCDGPAQLRGNRFSRSAAAAGETFALHLLPGPTDRTRLILGADVQRCRLELGPENLSARHVLMLEREDIGNPALAALDTRLDVCAVPPAGELDPLEQAFLADRWLSRSCAMPVVPVRLLPDATEAFNAKVAALTGHPLDPLALAVADPEMPLDFSQAPHLELILLSYLQLRADFSGRLILRMIEHHAARGTGVRILISDNLATRKDLAMLARLAAAYPSVQVQSFRWQPPAGIGPATLSEWLQRGNHTKAFATLAAEPERSRLILGGRNLHDGFLFDTPRNLSDHPELHDYNRRLRSPLAYFATYDDLEVEIAGDAAVRTITAHLGTLWHRDAASSVIRPFSVTTEVTGAPRRGMVHLLSVPQADGQALERWFVELFNAAERRIDIASPYLNPTPPLTAALKRALDRGVAVRILTPALPPTDPLSGLKTGFINATLRRLGPRVEAWLYHHPTRLLHAKLLIIDDRLTILSSANMNARSFLYDTENGIAVLDPAFADTLGQLFANWLSEAEPVGKAEAPGALVQFMLRSKTLRSWF